jgi:hypothetical protein
MSPPCVVRAATRTTQAGHVQMDEVSWLLLRRYSGGGALRVCASCSQAAGKPAEKSVWRGVYLDTPSHSSAT